MAKLILVPTPIGNLKDITLRAIETLQEVSLIIAEDTRVIKKLLNHLGIQKKVVSYHIHNEHHQIASLLATIEAMEKVALVSDAGTPGISDPGYLLVREAIQVGIEVECLPGPSAILPALVASGIPCDRFYFEGFLPHKKGRTTRLNYLSQLDCTLVLYESPHRLIKTITQLAEGLGNDRNAVVVKEISKVYERYFRGTLGALLQEIKPEVIKGEFVIIIGNTQPIFRKGSEPINSNH
ncbi:MAG: 16S rRNA (cytidine(1402)-2'-O)-methyltransferase [Flavobacteriales bacterium]